MSAAFNFSQAPSLPLRLESPMGTLEARSLLRFLPGQRLVLEVDGSNPALLKIIRRNRKGQRVYQQELQGHHWLSQAGLPMPAILFNSEDFHTHYAIAYEWLAAARPFSGRDLEQAGADLLRIMARMHQAGIVHNDVHLDNILFSKGQLYLVDYSEVQRRSRNALGEKDSYANLALLFAQFLPRDQQALLERLDIYFQARGWTLTGKARLQFSNTLRGIWRKRKNAYLKKCLRNCTMTAYSKSLSREYAFTRDFFEKAGAALLQEMEDLTEGAERLKDGNSATVVRLQYRGFDLVIKRYNMKHLGHLLRRCWRPSRAARSWLNGHLLALLGISTPRVLGFVENRIGPLRKNAYLICEYTEAEQLGDVYRRRPPSTAEMSQLRQLFRVLEEYRVSHGDLKASNLLLDTQGDIQLIDLDAMREHRRAGSFTSAWRRDRERFRRNWPEDAEMTRFLKQLPGA